MSLDELSTMMEGLFIKAENTKVARRLTSGIVEDAPFATLSPWLVRTRYCHSLFISC